jgi:hypothetical protein
VNRKTNIKQKGHGNLVFTFLHTVMSFLRIYIQRGIRHSLFNSSSLFSFFFYSLFPSLFLNTLLPLPSLFCLQNVGYKYNHNSKIIVHIIVATAPKNCRNQKPIINKRRSVGHQHTKAKRCYSITSNRSQMAVAPESTEHEIFLFIHRTRSTAAIAFAKK